MTKEEFLKERRPFLIDDHLKVIMARTMNNNNTTGTWTTNQGYSYINVVRGFEWNKDGKHFIHIYWNDYSVPSVTTLLIVYLFEYFKDIQYIGLGCNIGKEGEIWEPKYKIYKNE